MQKTSTEYVESMKKPLRNRAYLKASIGIVNSEAQDAIDYNDSSNSFTYFSNVHGVINNLGVSKIYATAEEDFSAVNGTMYFLPEQNEGKEYFHNGIVTEQVLGRIKIKFDGLSNITIKGLTIDFGFCYPTRFNIITDNDSVSFENNSSLFITGVTFANISYIIIEPTEMLHGNDKLRLISFMCGVTKLFTNENTINVSLTDYTSPITDTVPSMDMSFTVDNHDQTYCPDEDESLYAALEQGQVMQLQFGYDITGEESIEWLPPYRCYLSQWSATDIDASFSGVDIFDYKMHELYYKGTYNANGTTLYALAEDIFAEAGFVQGEYRIDSYLKKIRVKNPMPIVSQAEALEIVANAGRCVLKIERDGVISLDCSFVPQATVTANNQTVYSNLSNILKDTTKDFYAESSQDFSLIDDSMKIFPDNNSYMENTGYISESVYLGQNGVYNWSGAVPKLTITFDAAWEFYGLAIKFVSTIPEEVRIRTYLENVEVETLTLENSELTLFADNHFEECDKVEIEILKGAPNSRVFINSILISSITDYRLSRDYDIIDSPKAERMSKIQAISVIAYDYLKSADLQSVEVTLPVGNGTSTQIVTFDKPGYNFAASVTSGTATVSIINSGSYYVELRVVSSLIQNVKVKIEGYCYDIASKPYTKTHDTSGEIIEWKNPLISDTDYAEKLEDWLAQYYLGNIDYTVTWRGDPRVDANDLFYMELKDLPEKTRDDVMVRAYQSKLDFNGAWRGELRARKAVLSWQ